MKLSAFITAHLEKILVEWDAFARTLFSASTAPPHHLLRDDAGEILQAIVVYLDTHQTTAQQAEKSKGQTDEDVNKKSAAAIHGTLRQASGFTLTQLTAEYRALRATVLRLWMPHMQLGTRESATDMMRFNEAMDQALAESVVTYSENADRTRDTFLAILGHDLRSPLFTMSLAGNYLTRPAIGTEGTREMGIRVARGAANMTAMVNDLLEYARTQLGSGIPITLQPDNMAGICQAALALLSWRHRVICRAVSTVPACSSFFRTCSTMQRSTATTPARSPSRPWARPIRSRCRCATTAR